MKRTTVAVTLLVVTMVLLAGCGISKATYYAAVKESIDLKASLSSAQVDLAGAQQQLAAAITQRDTARAELDKVKTGTSIAQPPPTVSSGELAAAQQALSVLNASVKKYQSYVDVAEAYLGFRAISDSAPQADVVDAFFKIATAVSNVDDSSLKAAWGSVWDASAANRSTDNEMAAFSKLLAQKLAEMKPKPK